MSKLSRTEMIDNLVFAHANLEAMHAVVCAMESGAVGGDSNAARRIITIAKAERQRQYKLYAKARTQLLNAKI